MRTTFGVDRVGRRGWVKLALEVPVAEAIEVELPGKQCLEETDVLRSDRVESGDVPTGLAL
jgi:hypothetical protein